MKWMILTFALWPQPTQKTSLKTKVMPVWDISQWVTLEPPPSPSTQPPSRTQSSSACSSLSSGLSSYLSSVFPWVITLEKNLDPDTDMDTNNLLTQNTIKVLTVLTPRGQSKKQPPSWLLCRKNKTNTNNNRRIHHIFSSNFSLKFS